MSSGEIWYEAKSWINSISPVVVERYSASSVWIGGRRNARSSGGSFGRGGFFPSWYEAHQLIIAEASTRAERARRALDDADSRLAKAKAMRKPEP